MTLFFLLAGTTNQSSELLNQAIQEFQAGDYVTAQHSLQKLISTNPESAPAHNLLGLVFMEEKNYTEAIREFKATLRLNPKSAPAHVNLGNALVALHRDEKARDEYIQALSIHPDDSLALLNVGLIYARFHDDRQAAEYLQRAHLLDPRNTQATSALAAADLEQKNLTQAALLINELIRSGSGSRDQLLSLAQLSLEEGNPELGSKCVSNDPDLERSFAKMALVKSQTLLDSAQPKEALRVLQSVPASIRQTADYHDLLGTTYYQLDEPAKSVDELQQAIQLDHSNPDHYYKLGMMFLKHRTGDGAVLVFEASLKVRPDVPRLWMGLGLSYYIENNMEPAKENLYHAISLDPNNGPAYVVLCDLLSQTNADQELLAILDKARAVLPNDYLLPYYYGKVLAKKRNPGAIEQLQKSIAMNPQFSESNLELGKTLFQNGDFPGAIDSLTKCLEIDPNVAEAHYFLSRIYHRLGREDLAKDHVGALQAIRRVNGEDERIQGLIFNVENGKLP